MDPYVLGLLLGDGGFSGGSSVRFSTRDIETVEAIRHAGFVINRVGKEPRCDYNVNGAAKTIKALGLWGKKSNNKFVPLAYLHSSRANRLAILQGLLDTDGSASDGFSSVEFCSVSSRLAEDVAYLSRSIGWRAKISGPTKTSFTYKGEKKQGQPRYRVGIRAGHGGVPFRIKRKIASVKPYRWSLDRQAIVSIVPDIPEECQCIKIDDPDELYITDDFIVTHNTTCIINHHQRAALDDKWERERIRSLMPELTDQEIAPLLKNRFYGHVMPTRVQAKMVAWDMVKRIASGTGATFNEAELLVRYPNGSRFQLFGSDQPDSLRGPGFSGLSFDEYSQQPPNIFSEVLSKALGDHLGYAIFAGTVKGKDHLYRTYEEGSKSDKWETIWQDIDRSVATESGPTVKMLQRAMQDDMELVTKGLMTQDEFDQEWYCFPAGTLVSTSRGHVPIESIRIGDTVLTHRNRWRPVTRVMSRPYEGELIEISAFGTLRPLRCTPEHPVLVHHKKTQTREWKPAGEIQIGDCMITPKASMGEQVISETLAKLVAWFICEGSVHGNRVVFSLNGTKQEELDRVKSLLRELGYEWGMTYSNDKKSSANVRVNSVTLADRMIAWCGSGAMNKRIPFDVISGHEQVFFDEMIRGDGHVPSKRRAYHHGADSYSTCSPGLAFDVLLLASTLGRRAHISEVKGRDNLVICGVNTSSRDSYTIRVSRCKRLNNSKARDAFPSKLGMVYRVKNVNSEPFSGTVYNLAVKEDESYVAFGRAVHNCSTDAAIKGAIYIKELAAARADSRITRVPHDPMLPVDTDWDIGVGDATSIWFSQSLRTGEVRLIDYYHNSGEGLQHYVQELKKRNYTYGIHTGPHDIKVREWASKGKSRKEIAKDLGVTFQVCPKIPIDDGINAVRLFMAKCWFDEEKCRAGIESLRNYRRAFNTKMNEFTATPVHNWHSHAADAFRTLAVRHHTPKVAKAKQDAMDRAVSQSHSQQQRWMGT
jgi:intein/homing endonuclease